MKIHSYYGTGLNTFYWNFETPKSHCFNRRYYRSNYYLNIKYQSVFRCWLCDFTHSFLR